MSLPVGGGLVCVAWWMRRSWLLFPGSDHGGTAANSEAETVGGLLKHLISANEDMPSLLQHIDVDKIGATLKLHELSSPKIMVQAFRGLDETEIRQFLHTELKKDVPHLMARGYVIGLLLDYCKAQGTFL